MSDAPRPSHITKSGDVRIESYVDGEGPGFVLLPSYGRDGGDDFDDITARLIGDSWRVLRPQPRGVGASEGPMCGLTLHDLADDVAACIRSLVQGRVVLLGHAFGNALARVVATDHPDLVAALVLAAASSSGASKAVNESPFIAGDLARPDAERLHILQQNFFAPGHDAGVWLQGWHPATLRMQRQAVAASDLKASSAGGNAPILQVIAEKDPFNPKPSWNELTERLGDRVTQLVVANASHALFPEQPDAVAASVLPWAARRRSEQVWG